MANNRIINRLKKQKMVRRKELALLSFHEKILILVRLQALVNSVNRVKGKKQIMVWKV